MILFFVLTALTTFSTSAQIQQAWVVRYNNGITNGTNQAVKMVLDSSGNIYVTGFSQNSLTNLGYVTIKYAPNGNQLWASRYDSTNYPTAYPTSLALDNSNDVFVTGTALTVKYDSTGNELWTAPYAGTALAVDRNGNCAVTGITTNFGTVKLSPSGSNLWTAMYSSYGPGLGQQILTAADGSIYIAGHCTYICQESTCYVEMLALKYDSNGNQLWTASYALGDDSSVEVESAALDNNGSLYCVVDFGPFVDIKFVTLMYSTDGKLGWMSFPTSYIASQAHGLVLDQGDNVLLTGQVNYQYNAQLGTYDYYYGTFKLDRNGNSQWTNYFPQSPFGSSTADAIVTDLGNNSYITGYSLGSNSLNDVVTIKYDPSGNQVWLQRYNGPGNGNDVGNAIAVDKNGNVYVAGYDTTTAGGTEMVLIKYSPVILQRRPDGTVLLQTEGSPGESFEIQASADLLNWLDLGSVLADTNGLMQFFDTNASNYPARFYLTSPQ